MGRSALSLSLIEILSRLRKGLISPTELCEKCIKRANQLGELNAFITETHDVARKQAAHSQTFWDVGAGSWGIQGIPFAVKDNFSTAGIRTSCASNILRDYIPPYNATVVQKLLDQGACIVGKTNMDEFAIGSGSVNGCFGPIRNPWGYRFKGKKCSASGSYAISSQTKNFGVHMKDASCQENCKTHDFLEHQDTCQKDHDWLIAGGSSGGSCVSVAAGASFGALGSDTGGSTRLPAAFCGVVGLKPTYGRLSRHGLIPLVNSMDVPGIISKTVDDSALIFNILAGHDMKDSTTVQNHFEPLNLPEEPSVEGLCIGIPKEYYLPGTTGDMLSAWEMAADLLEDAGARVRQVSLPHFPFGISCYIILCCSEVASNMARYDGIEFGHRAKTAVSTEQLYIATRHKGFGNAVRERILAGTYFLLKKNYDRYYSQALKTRRLIAEDFQKVFDSRVDVILTPAALSDAPSYECFLQHFDNSQIEQDAYTLPVNLAGLPAAVVPAGLSLKHLPIGLQFIGQRFREQQLLTVAKWFEQQVDFPRLDLSFLDLD